MEREEEGEGVEQREEEGEGRRGDNASLPPAFSGTLWWVTYNTAETDEHLEEHGAHALATSFILRRRKRDIRKPALGHVSGGGEAVESARGEGGPGNGAHTGGQLAAEDSLRTPRVTLPLEAAELLLLFATLPEEDWATARDREAETTQMLLGDPLVPKVRTGTPLDSNRPKAITAWQITPFFACEREIELSAGLSARIMLTYYGATVYFVSVRCSRILRGVPMISRGTVDGRLVDRAVPSEVWKYKKRPSNRRPLPSRQRLEALAKGATIYGSTSDSV
ncbi:hypothetical protein B0H13DRAFT_1905503 [Mycena leptocephala]|nr:hypothetical protein B0H13DRAFT_1905503 [Mycena leptocephala]